MLVADKWKEYEVLDAGDGAKLERWGNGTDSFILARPDPQILWPKEKPELWTSTDGIYTRTTTGGGWKFNRQLPEKWLVSYNSMAGELKFLIRPTDFKHMGLFPEQAVNWDWMSALIKKSTKKIKVLNLFAYTGGATIACAKAGAEVTHVDASKGIVEWAKSNADLNSLEARWIVDDVMKFAQREARRGNKYDAIIMDPPSYGRGKNGETWKIEKMLSPLIARCKELLVNKPLFFLLNSYTKGLGPTVVQNILESAMNEYDGKTTTEEIALPIMGSKKILPAGLSGRWESNM